MKRRYYSWLLYSSIVFSLFGCSPSWTEPPYEIYWIDGVKTLGYSVGDGAFISRVDEPVNIASNNRYLSVYACPETQCAFYYIDKEKDHKYADHDEFVYGPFSRQQFESVANKNGLPFVLMNKD